MVLAHAEEPSILPRAQRCQPHTRRDKLIAASQKLGASLTMRGDELVVIEQPGVLA
jgi:hypothetical protein